MPLINIYFIHSEDCIVIQGSNLKECSIFDMIGQEYFAEITIPSDEIKINNKNFEQGVYLVKVKSDSQVIVKKIIIF